MGRTWGWVVAGVLIMAAQSVMGQITVAGKTPYDKVLIGFFNQNQNASNMVRGLNLYSPLAFENGMVPAVLSGKTYAGTLTGTNSLVFRVYDTEAGEWEYWGLTWLGGAAGDTNTVSRIGRTEVLRNKTLVEPVMTNAAGGSWNFKGTADSNTVSRQGDALFWGVPLYGSGSPEGVVTGAVGRIYLNTSGGTTNTLWVKESGTGATGWVNK